ncbi:ATP-binding protein [Sphingomonas sp. MMS24-JH45]
MTHELKNPLASLRSAADALEDGCRTPSCGPSCSPSSPTTCAGSIGSSATSRMPRASTRSWPAPPSSRSTWGRCSRRRSRRAKPARAAQRRAAPRIRPAGRGPRGARRGGAARTRLRQPHRQRGFLLPAGGTVAIAARAERGDLEVRVEDEGPGVPEEAREAIFRRFHCVRPAAEAFGEHSGLGLAIARTIVEGHQGRIAVEPREDRLSGARFVVRLPLTEETP